MRKPQPSHQNEWFIKQQVKRIFDDTGWTYWMPAANAFGRGGQSDFLAVKKPKLFMAIETKHEDVPTQLQINFLAGVHAAGHYAFLVDETNVEELRDVLTEQHVTSSSKVFVFGSFMRWKEQETLTNT